MRILLVEDEPEMGRLVGSIVRSAGFAVDFVSALADAREATRQHPYDLVLLDRRLPDGDGVLLRAHASVDAPRSPHHGADGS